MCPVEKGWIGVSHVPSVSDLQVINSLSLIILVLGPGNRCLSANNTRHLISKYTTVLLIRFSNQVKDSSSLYYYKLFTCVIINYKAISQNKLV